MAYSHTTFAQAKTQLAIRLGDSSKAFWPDAELGRYLVEALRTFNALAWFQRTAADAVDLSAHDGTALHSLPSLFPAECAHTVTDRDLVEQIQSHLLEPVSGSSWTGTEMFTLAGVAAAIQRARDRFLSDTALVLSESSVAGGTASPTQLLTLSDAVIDIRRVSWQRTSDAKYYILFREDEHSLSSGDPAWTVATGNPPLAYAVLGAGPLQLQPAPAESALSTFHILAVESGAALDPGSSETVLGVPDDLSWAVKWGALADLLGRDGQAYDPQRARYCERMYALGVRLGLLWQYVLHADIDGSPLLPTPLHDLDTGDPDWQNESAPRTPELIGLSGDYIALAPPPDDQSVELSLRLLANMTVPSGDTDQIQVGREHLDLILDQAQHLAAFKMGGAEFEATMPIHERFMAQAIAQNSRLAAQSRHILAVEENQQGEDDRRPRFLPPTQGVRGLLGEQAG